MIRNNDIIQGYTVLMVANGMVLAYSETAPDPYVVWHTTEDGSGVYDGKYLPNKEDAEWDFCMKAFPWFEDNAPINVIEDNAAEKIDSFKWYLDDAKERVESCRSVLDEIQEAMDNASALVEDMVAEHEKLVGKKAARRRKATIPKSTIFLILTLMRLSGFHLLFLNSFQSSKTSQSQKRNRC